MGVVTQLDAESGVLVTPMVASDGDGNANANTWRFRVRTPATRAALDSARVTGREVAVYFHGSLVDSARVKSP